MVKVDSLRDVLIIVYFSLSQIHGDLIVNNADVFVDTLERIQHKQKRNWLRLQTLFQSNLALIRFFSNLPS
jgi:hypothetical protein